MGKSSGSDRNSQPKVKQFKTVSGFIKNIEAENAARITSIKKDADYLAEQGKYLFYSERKFLEDALASEREVLAINQQRVKTLKRKFKL